eukprot:TRINITY_DN5919_c0_g2_i1.p1 TRINITY_DN5919_c0_g2~~TRINITY_DN5919_c0_g2_i1.p1  ORF type:complete len:265 (+),score=-0.84 TRINITY_DN5919_c0_g2_i1:426-1220(+)
MLDISNNRSKVLQLCDMSITRRRDERADSAITHMASIQCSSQKIQKIQTLINDKHVQFSIKYFESQIKGSEMNDIVSNQNVQNACNRRALRPRSRKLSFVEPSGYLDLDINISVKSKKIIHEKTRGHYKVITNEMRKELVDLVIIKGLTIRQAGIKLRIKYSTAKSIVMIFKQCGRMYRENQLRKKPHYTTALKGRNNNNKKRGGRQDLNKWGVKVLDEDTDYSDGDEKHPVKIEEQNGGIFKFQCIFLRRMGETFYIYIYTVR